MIETPPKPGEPLPLTLRQREGWNWELVPLFGEDRWRVQFTDGHTSVEAMY